MKPAPITKKYLVLSAQQAFLKIRLQKSKMRQRQFLFSIQVICHSASTLLIELSKEAAKSSETSSILKSLKSIIISAWRPSGTALMIADGISDQSWTKIRSMSMTDSYRRKRSKNEIGIHSVRGGTIVGEHEVIFAGHDEAAVNFIRLSQKKFSLSVLLMCSILKIRSRYVQIWATFFSKMNW